MLPDLMRLLAHPRFLALQQESYRRDGRVAPGRFEYSFLEFVIFAVVLLGLTFFGLQLARRRREARDERLTASSGGWRIRSQLDLDAGSPCNRFPGLALRMPHDVMEGDDEGFEVSYFRGHLSSRAGDSAEAPRVPGDTARRRDVPHSLVQLPVDPPQRLYVAADVSGYPVDGWGAHASLVLSRCRGVVVAGLSGPASG